MKTPNWVKTTLMIAASLMIMSACDKEENVAQANHPEAIKSYVATHFPASQIVSVVKDIDGLTTTYDVILTEGFKLEFNKKLEIIEIDGTTKLPDSVIPAKILSYVTANYPTNVIVGWQLEGKNQQIELDNDIELEFDSDGNFLRIDN